jgi:C-terminal processing protease CtpA/Prc
MLLDLRQSNKVTIFGEHTMGAVDYLDFYPLEAPSGKYRLYIPTTKRTLTKAELPIDGKGIYPDVPIADSVKDWIGFVQTYYDEH